MPISHRIQPIEGFYAVSVSATPVDDAPTDRLKANNFRLTGYRIADIKRTLDIDFQGVEAKINYCCPIKVDWRNDIWLGC